MIGIHSLIPLLGAPPEKFLQTAGGIFGTRKIIGGQNMVPSNPAKSENVYTRIMMAGQPTPPLWFDEALLRETNGEKMLSSQ